MAPKAHQGFWRKHSLTFAVGALLGTWIWLYLTHDPSTHWGSFYGNAIADWTGTAAIVVSTKYLHEFGSRESKPTHPRSGSRFRRFIAYHSLTLTLLSTWLIWILLFARNQPDSKAGQVYGNIASEWGQLLGLVVLTKYFRESGSKE